MWTTVIWITAGLSTLHWLGVWLFGSRLWRELREAPVPLASSAFGPITILAPVKGIDPDFKATLDSLLHQDVCVPYDIIFALGTDADPAHGLIASEVAAAEGAGTMKARRVLRVNAGLCHDRGQKVHNLTAGLAHLSADTRALCFIDSDARPPRHWIAAMTAPLHEVGTAAATGFRWYLPEHGGSVMAFACLWNAYALGIVARRGKNFAWGGSMAIRRDVFDQCQVVDRYWKSSVSDDGGLTRALHDAHLNIRFVPSCLLPSLQDLKARDLWEFMSRQFVITRFYLPHIFRIGLISSVIDVCGFWGALLYVLRALTAGQLPLGLITLIFLSLLSMNRLGHIRYVGSQALFPDHLEAVSRTRMMLLWGGPLVPLINLITLLTALTRRTIVWRKIRYTFERTGTLKIEHPSETSVP